MNLAFPRKVAVGWEAPTTSNAFVGTFGAQPHVLFHGGPCSYPTWGNTMYVFVWVQLTRRKLSF